MASSSVDGLISGLDTTSIISQLMTIERQPQDQLRSKKSDAAATAERPQQPPEPGGRLGGLPAHGRGNACRCKRVEGPPILQSKLQSGSAGVRSLIICRH